MVLLAASASSVLGNPGWFSYQGRLINGSGTTLPDGTYTVRFRLYGSATGGTHVWEETKSVTLRKGVFASQLGLPANEGGNPFATGLFSQRLWLGITVGNNAEMTPRQELGAAPFALGVTAGAISSSSLANNSVTTAKLADGSVTTAKLADNAVNAAKLAGDAASLTKMTSGQVTANGSLFRANAYQHVFSLAPNGGGQMVLGNNANDNQVWVEFFNATGNGSATRANFTGYLGETMSSMVFKSSESSFGGRLFLNHAGFGGSAAIPLAIGDGDTGLGWAGDGRLIFHANGGPKMELNPDILWSNVPIHAPGFHNNSSIRFKDNVRELQSILPYLGKLRPVSFRYKNSKDKTIGFIAEDVVRVFPEIVSRDSSGEPNGIDYSKFSAILVKSMQEQEARHTREKHELSRRLESLEARLQRLERGR